VRGHPTSHVVPQRSRKFFTVIQLGHAPSNADCKPQPTVNGKLVTGHKIQRSPITNYLGPGVSDFRGVDPA
jgi:hypothetical protein